jgi:MFS family permease
MRMLVATAVGFGVLEAVTAFAPDFWLFTVLLAVVGLLGLTFNTSGNSMVQLETDPTMRGRVMSLYMMVFTGGTPIGGPIVGWLTEEFGPRFGLFACGAVSAASAALIGVVLARAAGLRLRISGRRVALVPRDGSPAAVSTG